MSDVKTSDAAPPLDGKIVVVTGASSGIGRAIALACARSGADILTTYRRNRPGAELILREIAALGRRGYTLQADVAREEDVAALISAVGEHFGRVDAWINNAGADVLTGDGAQLSRLAKLDLLLAVDLRGTMLASWAAADLMKGQPSGGTVINVSWDRVLDGFEGENPELFSAVKGGVLSFSRSLARSVAPKVRVNVLGPGWIKTSFAEGVSQSFKDRVARSVPLQRWGEPEDVAGSAVFLASDAARYLTGQIILINGGDVMR